MTPLPEMTATPAPPGTDFPAHGPDGCRKCRTIPDGPPATGVLYLAPPVAETHASLKAAGVAAAAFDGGLLAVGLRAGTLDRLAADLVARLTQAELQGVRALVLPAGRAPTLADLMGTQPLGAILESVRNRWLAEVLRDDRLETHFQPIVSAADPGRVFAYECLIRGVDDAGKLIPPRDLFAAARSADLLFHLDRSARLCAIRSAAVRNVRTRLFLNFNPSSIYTPAYCLKTTFRAVEAAGLSPEQVVFEVVESDEVRDTKHLLNILSTYREAGFKVALDDVGAGYSSLSLLTQLRPDFMKLDMGLVRGVDLDPYKAQVAGKLLEMAQGLGVRTIVEGVETPGEQAWAVAAGADYAQGYLFARPAAEPPLRDAVAA